MEEKALIMVYSYHNMNTEKIAKAMAKVLMSPILKPQQVSANELNKYSIIGFGSGIYDGKHHELLIGLVDKLPHVTNKKAFIFSTCGLPNIFINEEIIKKNHLMLKQKLQSKGYIITGEFECSGLNTNGFLKVFKGINKGRPNSDDLKRAEKFALDLID